MKIFFVFLFTLFSLFSFSQCNEYFIYESFSTSLPTQKGTWVNTSVPYGTTSSTARTGSNYLTFNGLNDAIRLPQISNPGVLSFYYRRSSTSTGTPKFTVETSPDGTTWTERLSVTSFSTTYVLATVDLGTLGLTNIHIRIIDKRASGNAERYIDDLSLTSTVVSENTLIPFLAACSETLDVSYTYTITDNSGPANGNYSGPNGNSLNRTITFSPSDNTKKLNLSFTSLDLETNYDFLYVYDGPNTSSTLLATLTGTTTPSDITATNSNGVLTLRWTTDIINTGSWGGFVANITTLNPLPVELVYFDGISYSDKNILSWETESENDSDYFLIQRSQDGINWVDVMVKSAAGNSNSNIKYVIIDQFQNNGFIYYRLLQYDIDGKFKVYGPISLYYVTKNKKLIKYTNLLGQEVPSSTNGVILEIYDDGTTRKIIR